MNRYFTGLCGKDKPLYTDDVADVKVFLEDYVIQAFIFTGTDIVPSDVNLNLSFCILEFCEGSISHDAPAHDPACQRNILVVELCALVVFQNINTGSVYLKQLGRIRVDPQ